MRDTISEQSAVRREVRSPVETSSKKPTSCLRIAASRSTRSDRMIRCLQGAAAVVSGAGLSLWVRAEQGLGWGEEGQGEGSHWQ